MALFQARYSADGARQISHIQWTAPSRLQPTSSIRRPANERAAYRQIPLRSRARFPRRRRFSTEEPALPFPSVPCSDRASRRRSPQ